MRQARTQQTSFTAGELDASLWGRIEVARYYAGAGLLRNMLVVPQGGIRRRPGMRFLNVLERVAPNEGPPPEGNDVRLIPFAFNTQQTYAIALTAGAFHVFRADGELVHIGGSCPWTGPQAAQMNYTQSADTLLLTHPAVPPQRIRRAGSDTAWTCDPMPLANVPQHDYGAGPEPVISATRGWPECCTFHQGRLYLAGFASRPSTLMGSVVADFFNFDQGSGLDDRAIYWTINSDQVNAIHQLRSSRTLQVFTSGAEFSPDVNPPYTPKNFSLIEQTRRGVQQFTPVSEVDGATLFVQAGGAALRQFLFTDTEAAFTSNMISLLAPHLIRRPRELAARRGVTGDDADHVMIANVDGETTVLTTLRAQEIVAFSRWATTDPIRSVCALASGEVFFAVERNNAIYVEQWDEGRYLDSSVRVQNPAGVTSVAGLSHLDGRTVGIMADDAYLGTVTVEGDSVTLPRAAQDVEVGLLFTPVCETLPIEPRDATGAIIGRKARIAAVTARVRETGIFQLNGRDVVLRLVGSAPAAPLDTPPPIFTGDIRLHGLVGWKERQAITIRQEIPSRFNLLALAYDLRIGE